MYVHVNFFRTSYETKHIFLLSYNLLPLARQHVFCALLENKKKLDSDFNNIVSFVQVRVIKMQKDILISTPFFAE